MLAAVSVGHVGSDCHLLNMSEIISTSLSAAAIFWSLESWGGLLKRKDILEVEMGDYISPKAGETVY